MNRGFLSRKRHNFEEKVIGVRRQTAWSERQEASRSLLTSRRRRSHPLLAPPQAANQPVV